MNSEQFLSQAGPFSGGGDGRPDASEQVDYLALIDVPSLLEEQLMQFRAGTMAEAFLPQVSGDFDTVGAVQSLQDRPVGDMIYTLDQGGSGVTEVLWILRKNGILEAVEVIDEPKRDERGTNFISFFERTATKAHARGDIPVSISNAGPLTGSKPDAITNAPALMEALAAYNGDYANLYPTLTAVNNDAVAGIMSAAVVLLNKGELDPQTAIILPIRSGGHNVAGLKDGKLIKSEFGHARIVDALNRNPRQNQECGLLGARGVCVELGGAASGVGTEALYLQATGQQLDGPGIRRAYLGGDRVAARLLDRSALLQAHAIEAFATHIGALQSPNDTIVAFHGGGWYEPSLQRRALSIVDKARGFTPRSLPPDGLACSRGAAIAGLTSGRPRRGR